MEIKEWTRDDGFAISTNKELLDLEAIYPIHIGQKVCLKKCC